ncbi:hypothetical protein CONCODRAFT_4507 [Conidiobolus coronatus NRRL 28638]|uniref:Uncharacterized protein n=1 Tax=Conidiobolus coronatus (strain ATCC 28846 / CBS 209.66 / NRRL 28638) TaxID=796925 RepID=A0A137PCC7_CONC2|nr:hypothetical protein CONCODRAFT_4507 [Conidiobolus coronatus NRRL 28638]|eukprot:KXN72646.1 hypothetical protein CONCODRAFT_4507 [Conidiobolus coronatus NRRL 28638]
MVGYYFLDAFTGTSSKAGCNPGTRDPTNSRAFSILAGLFCLITILSGILVTFFGHRNMNRWVEVYLNNGAYHEEDKEELKKKLRRMAQLSFLYPLATCITLPCEMAFNFKMATGVRDRNLISGMAITGGISGLLTLIAFAIDPTVWRTFKAAFIIIKQRRLGVTETKDSNDIELMDL